MIKTYIYGVPHGFDFYEKKAELNDYFKGFYISSRKGRRLMINRRDNGETIYSYLRYGLKEVDRQPLHSFFGMSLVVDNYQFCPNFKVLLEWFDYLFNKLVNDRSLIKKNEDGIFHYVIYRFDENSADVEWLKLNLPNILTQAGQTEIANYDNSFVDGKAGQVASFNYPVGENCLLEAFKKYRWLSISSEIIERREITSGDSMEIELNFEELNGKLNEYNQQLLPIAVDISKGLYADLKRMADEVQEISTSLAKYLPMIDDLEEKEKFGGLDSKYDSLKSSIGTLLSKLSTSAEPFTPQPPKQKIQYCFSCKQNKPLSHFRSTDAIKCLECEEQDRRRIRYGTNVPKGYKTCISCGKSKSARSFNQVGTDICDECAKIQKPVSLQEGLFEKLGKILLSKGFLGAVASVAVVFAVINLPNGCGGGEKRTAAISTNRTVTGEAVDRQKLENLIADNDFKAVYEYIKDKKDAAGYKSSLKDAVQKYLRSKVDTPQSNIEGVLESFLKFYVDNFQFLDFINFGEQEKQYLTQFAKDYFYVWDLIKNAEITQEDKDKGIEILTKHTELFPKGWTKLLNNVKVKSSVSDVNANVDKKSTTSDVISISYTSSDGKPVKETISGHREIFIKEETPVAFNYPNGYIRTRDEVLKNKKVGKAQRIFKPQNKIIIYCGEIGITITPVKVDKEKFTE